MAIDQNLHDRIKAIAQELRQEVYGASGTPTWGTKFTEIEDLGVEIGDLLAREVIGQSLEDQGRSMAVPTTAIGPDGAGGRSKCGWFRLGEARLHGQNPRGTTSLLGRLFFPQSQALGIAPDDTASPRVLEKMVYAGTQSHSFRQAEQDLKHLAATTGQPAAASSARGVRRDGRRTHPDSESERRRAADGGEAEGAFLARDESGMLAVDDQ